MSDNIFEDETREAAGENPNPAAELSSVLQQVSGQLRLSLGNIYSALCRLAPPDARDENQKTDMTAAVLCQSYFRILRLTNNLSEEAEAMNPPGGGLHNGDIVAVCQQVMERAEQPARLLGIQTEFRCNRQSCILAMNKDRMERMLLNLLSNSFKFIRKDEKKVILEVKVEQDFVRLVLTDTGAGMTAEELDTAFDRCRLTDRQDPPPHGLGLGLPICRRIAAEHGGTLVMTSTPDVGTAVTVSLPKRKLPIQQAKEPYILSPGSGIYGGFNPTLVELSDALGAEAFTQKYLD